MKVMRAIRFGGTEVLEPGEGVDEAWLGRRVVAETGQTGAYAERAVVPAERAFAVPDGLGLRAAIAALHDGLMALDRLEKANIEPGRRVLVNAAGGGIGVWLVPLLNAAGARVVAAAGSEPKRELARERGAEVVADYTRPGWDRHVRDRLDGDGVHVVFDGAGGEIGRAAFGLTERGGRFFAYGAAGGEFADFAAEEAQRRDITLSGIEDDIDPKARQRLTERALSELAAGSIAPVVGQALPLERAAEAHAALAERTVTGKSLLLVGEEAA